jgi:hypothetical protein
MTSVERPATERVTEGPAIAVDAALVTELHERIDVDSRDEKAVAVWRAATDEGVNRSDSVYEWLRR